MSFEKQFAQIQKEAPEGIHITKDPDAVPAVCVIPESRTPLQRSEDGQLKLVMLAQPTKDDTDLILTVPDVLGIHGDSQISPSRANRIMQAGQTSAPDAAAPRECDLDEPRTERPAWTANNPRPFGPLTHKVVFSSKHIDNLNDADLPAAVRDATEHFYEMAERGHNPVKILDGLTIGMNFGIYVLSGASQIHFHYQLAGLGRANFNAADRLGAFCQAHKKRHSGADYLADYEQTLKTAGLVVEENEWALACVPISPRFKGEVQIMLKSGTAGNILEATEREREALASLQCTIMKQFSRLGCQAFNQVWLMTRFSTKNTFGQRLIVSLCPRTSIVAFYELSGNSVIDALPWAMARALRSSSGFTLSCKI